MIVQILVSLLVGLLVTMHERRRPSIASDRNAAGILTALGAIAGAVGSALGAVGSAVGSAAGAVGSAVGSAASAVGSAAATATSALGGTAGAAAGGAAGAAGAGAGAAAGGAAGAAGAAGSAAAGAAGGAAGAAGSAAGAAGGAAGSAAGGAAGAAGGATTAAGSTAASAGAGAAGAGTGIAPATGVAGTSGVAEVPAATTGATGSLGGSATGATGGAAEGAAQAPTSGLQSFLQSDVGKLLMKQVGGGGGGGGEKEQSRGQAAASGAAKGLGDAGDYLLQQANRPIGQAGANEVLRALASIGLEGRAEGGPVNPGQTVVTGEQGPETVTAKPDGGAQVTPLEPKPSPGASPPAYKAATPQGQGFDWRDHLQSALVGLFGGQEGLDARRHANAEQQKFLATAGIQHPLILATDPNVAGAVDAMLGPGASQSLLNEYDPNFQARALARVHGLQLVSPGTPLADGSVAPSEITQFAQEMQRRGSGLTYTSKGEMRITQQPRSPESQDSVASYGIWGQIKDNLVSQGMNDTQATIQAAKRTLQIGAARGITVPKELVSLANANTETAIAAARAGVEAAARNVQELRFAAPIAAAREAGTRSTRINQPIAEDEIRARDVTGARNQGGVVYGRELKDDELLTAEASKQVFKLTPEGNYIGIPKDVAGNDPAYLSPRELLTKRIAQKMADKKTTQNENAQIVLGALDDLDNVHALDLLPHAAPQGAGLGSQLAGALQTEVRGQTEGRASVWAARRSLDATTREKAIALINLGTLSTSVVKALGDVGAISEADKSVFNQRIGRVMSGTASQEEAATMTQQLRQLMVRAAAGPVSLQDAHTIINSPPNPMAPPTGYTPFAHGYYSVTP